MESLKSMSRALGVSTDYLLFGSGDGPIPQDLVDALSDIPPAYYELLVRQIRLLGDIINR